MDVTDWTGKVIDGRYEVLGLIGRGGMGVVLRARHRYTGAQVALKLLRPDLPLDDGLRARFLAEARTPTAIGHGGIVSVLDAGCTPDGTLYFAMELLEGESLRAALAHGPLPRGEVRRVGMELLDPLAAAHARGIVHRDLKPENVFLAGPSRSVKLLDFGIAKSLDGTASRAFTAAGSVLGTAQYMAPEQLEDAAGVDARADLWAVGAIVYEMLCGRTPYAAAANQGIAPMLLALAQREPDPIRAFVHDIDPAIEAFLARCLVRDRARRFASAAEMAHAFAALPLAGTERPVPPRPPTQPPVIAAGSERVDAHGATVATGLAFVPSVPPPVAPAPPSIVPLVPSLGPVAPSVPPPVAPAPPSIVPLVPSLGPVAPSAPPPPLVPSVPPPSSPAPPSLVPHVPPPAPLVAAPPGPSAKTRSQTKIWLAIGIAVLVLAGISAYLKQRREEADKKKPARSNKSSSRESAGPTGDDDSCEEACRHLDACGAPEPDCVARCTSGDDNLSCLRSDGDSCEAMAACFFRRNFKVVPGGEMACASTAMCCSGNDFERCRDCVARTKPEHAVALASLLFCSAQCTSGTNCDCGDRAARCVAAR